MVAGNNRQAGSYRFVGRISANKRAGQRSGTGSHFSPRHWRPLPMAKCSTNIDAIGHIFGMPKPVTRGNVVANKRKIIVHIATSADG